MPEVYAAPAKTRAAAPTPGRQVALYCADEPLRHKVERLLPHDRQVRPAAGWEAFERAAVRAECSVVAIPWLSGDPATQRLAAFKASHPLHPVVLVTRGDIENARGLKDARADDVVWTHELARELGPAVCRTCSLSQARAVAVELRRTAELPPRLREALALACEVERPFRSVEKLAAAVGCDRRTLWHQWRQEVDPDPELHLQDFLHWLILLRASGRKTRCRSWAAVAGELGTHPDTLGRLSRKLTGSTLSELEARGQSEIGERFAAAVLDRLGAGTAADKLRRIGHFAVGHTARPT